MAKTRKDIFHLNAGEWGRKVYNRVDHEKHASACRQARNVISTAQGTVIKRKGFELVAPVKFDSKKVNLVRFRFSKSDTVCIELGDLYVRFHTNGQQVRETDTTIDSVTAANPAVVSSTAHGYSDGDEIYVSGLSEMVEMNGRWLLVSASTANAYEVTDRDGNAIDSSTWTAETTGGSAEKVYEIASVYTESDLPNLDYAQKNDVMWFCDGANPVQQLIRFAPTTWTFGEYELSFPPALDPNVEAGDFLNVSSTTGTGLTMTATGHAPFVAAHVGSYWVLRHLRPSQQITAAGVGNAIDVLGNVTLETGGIWFGTINVHKETFSGSGTYTIVGTYTSVNNKEKNFNVRFTEAGESRKYYLSGNVGGSAATLRSEAAVIEGAVKVTAFTSSTVVTVDVVKDLSATTQVEDWSEGAWSGVQGYPSVVCLFEKAIWFARTNAFPQGIWKSEVDLFDSFAFGTDDTSGLFIELDSKERNDILWIVDQDKLMIGTSGSEWTLSGTDLNSIISPTNVVARRQENKGSKDVRPETVDDVIMYMQRGSSESLRAMSFSIERDKFHANNMQEFSEHLTTSGIVSMAYQGSPDPVLWCCTGDGQLLSFTYERDQKVFAWNPHDTAGLFEDVETIYGSEDDEVWVAVNRTIDGVTRRFVERLTGYYNSGGASGFGLVAFIIDLSGSMQNAIDEAVEEAIVLATSMATRYSSSRFALYTIADTGNTVVQRSAFTSSSEVIDIIATLTQQGTGTEDGFEAIIRASDELDWDGFGDADKHMILITDEDSDNSATQADAITAALSVGAKVSFGTFGTSTGSQGYEPVRSATGGAHFSTMSVMVTEVEAILAEVGSSSSQKVFVDSSLQLDAGNTTTIRGLWHLEGATVDALVDGYVYEGLVVAEGAITLPDAAISAFVGLKYSAVVQPMQLNADGNLGAAVGYTKVVSHIYATLIDTIGLSYNDGAEDREVTFRSGNQDQSLPPQPLNEEIELHLATGHEKDPIVIFKHDKPLPFTLAGLVVHSDVTGT